MSVRAGGTSQIQLSAFVPCFSSIGHSFLVDAFDDDTSSEWDRPIRTTVLGGISLDAPSVQRKKRVITNSAEMDLVMLPSTIQVGQLAHVTPKSGSAPRRVSDYRLGPRSTNETVVDVKQRSGRIWVATLVAPPNNGIDATFFEAFPQKHQVVRVTRRPLVIMASFAKKLAPLLSTGGGRH